VIFPAIDVIAGKIMIFYERADIEAIQGSWPRTKHGIHYYL